MTKPRSECTRLPTVPAHVPLGANIVAGSTQFSLFSRHATRVWLRIYHDLNAPEDEFDCELELDPVNDRFGDIWHIRLEGVEAGDGYLFRMDGPTDPKSGHRYNKDALLLDPYAKAISGGLWSQVPMKPGKVKCIVVDDHFDWQNDKPLGRALEDTVIYETHVRGLTIHPSSRVKHPGTFRGIIEKIPYLKELGITAVELLPLQEFDEMENRRYSPSTGKPLYNYWGYSTVSFFSPNGQYATSATGGQVAEFKEMVRALHKAGIEVILDIVFNHTAEGNDKGPVLCFRGIDNSIYYMLDDDKSSYKNFSGCGNTVNCNHPVVRKFVYDCLRYWVLHMHVDGFRFDLASILGRDRFGNLMDYPPLVESISEDPILRSTKIIAEAWDAGGAYQVGHFFSERWAEWNGRYRDDVRSFWRGDAGTKGQMATRLSGSPDLYESSSRLPVHSINFVTSHDGFTLLDLVSYNEKHNEANGEHNNDGDNNNLSSNHGVEGPSQDEAINILRTRQRKNIFATLMLSQGVPMILGGDEMGRTQLGNNNAYCQDNETSWYDWRLLDKEPGYSRFCKEMIAFRKNHPTVRRKEFLRPGTDCKAPDVLWLGPDGNELDWNDGKNILGCLLSGAKENTCAICDDEDILILINGDEETTPFALPQKQGESKWRRAVYTALDSPDDISESGQEAMVETETFDLEGHSLAVLIWR